MATYFYTSPQMVEAAFPDAIGTIPSDLMNQSIVNAESEVNAYLAGLYVLPLGVTVPLLSRIATDIAIYFIWTARPFTPPPRTVETQWPKRYDDAVALLQQIQAGELLLVTDGGAVVPPAGAEGFAAGNAAWSNTERYVPTFGEGDDRRFRVDPEKLDAEASRRQVL